MIEEIIDSQYTEPIQDIENNFLPNVIYPEVNILRLPFFALSWRGLKSRTKTEYRHVEVRDGKKVELLWRVTANAEYGYPSPFDRKVARAVDAIIHEIIIDSGYPLVNPIPFSIYRVGQLIGFKNVGGSIYEEVKISIKRIVATTIESSGSFFLKDEKRWIEKIFHLYEDVVFSGKSMSGGVIAETNYLWLGREYLSNINTMYTRPIDYKYLNSLKSDLASRLYELLSGKFYGLPEKEKSLRISYSNICQTLPIKTQTYYSDAKRYLNAGHKELIETGFLSKVVYQRYEGKRDFNIKYYPGKRAKREREGGLLGREKISSVEEQLTLPLKDKASNGNVQRSELVQELHQSDISKSTAAQLTQRGITKAVANTLFRDFPIDQIQKQIEIFDCLVENKSSLVAKNPAGFLRRSIEENYQPPAEYNQKQEREILEQKRTQERAEKEAEQARLDEIQRQVDKYRDGLSDEERQLLRQEAVEFIDGDKSIKKAFVTEHLIRAKENDIIREILKLE